MPTNSLNMPGSSRGGSVDFWKFGCGQTISSLGSSFTSFALPLLVFKITGSALNLAIAAAVTFLPYLLFGLLIGAWADRVNRKRLMISSDIASTLLVASIPLLAMFHLFALWWIYIVMFTTSSLAIAFTAAQTAVIPKLVDRNKLLTANGRIQASYSATTIIGPILAGLLTTVMPIQMVLFFDALSFLLSAVSLALIRTDLSVVEREVPTSVGQDIVEGLRYVFGHPVLRTISIMTGLLSFLGSTVETQVVLFATQQLHANNTELGLLFAAGGTGVFVLSLSANSLNKFGSFSKVAMASAILKGLVMALLGLTSWYWTALPLWALSEGLPTLFSINTLSLRQAIVPDYLLGRVQTIARVISWSAIPLGTFIGGVVIDQTHNVALVYTAIGTLNFLISLGFLLSPLGHAERYLAEEKITQELHTLAPSDRNKDLYKEEIMQKLHTLVPSNRRKVLLAQENTQKLHTPVPPDSSDDLYEEEITQKLHAFIPSNKSGAPLQEETTQKLRAIIPSNRSGVLY